MHQRVLHLMNYGKKNWSFKPYYAPLLRAKVKLANIDRYKNEPISSFYNNPDKN